MPDDYCLKHRRVTREDEDHDYAISSSMIVEMIEESRRLFWQFLRADKDAGNMIQNGPQKNHVTLQNDGDLAFLMHIRADLQKVFTFLLSKFQDIFCLLIGLYIGLYFMISTLISLMCLHAEGEKAQRHTEKRKLHSKEVPKESKRETG